MDPTISQASFVNFQCTGDGGVICSEDKTLTVICCYFNNNFCTHEGGSIYMKNSALFISKTIFRESYSTAKANDIRGNAINLNANKLHVNMSVTFLCGPDSERHSDSSINSFNSRVIANEYNATNNYGIEGGSGISIFSCLQDTLVIHSIFADGHDGYMIESSKLYNVNSTNFVNCSSCAHSVCYSSSDDLYIFDSCVFWNTGSKGLVNSGYSLTLINCLTNSQVITKCTTTSSVRITLIKTSYKCNRNPIIKTCRRRRDSFTSLTLQIILLVSKS